MTAAPTPLFLAEDIAARADAMATAIAKDLGEEFVLLCVLNGAFVFTADLARALAEKGCRPRIEFASFKSYGNSTESASRAKLVGDLPDSLVGVKVLLVGDILDTGRTLLTAKLMIEEAKAASVATCVLLDKPARRRWRPTMSDLKSTTCSSSATASIMRRSTVTCPTWPISPASCRLSRPGVSTSAATQSLPKPLPQSGKEPTRSATHRTPPGRSQMQIREQKWNFYLPQHSWTP